MQDFTETAAVAMAGDGYLSLTVDREYDDGVRYHSVLYVQTADAAAFGEALERFTTTAMDQALTLVDGTLQIFAMPPSPMVNIELDRANASPHGGYDTCILAPASAAAVVLALKAFRADSASFGV